MLLVGGPGCIEFFTMFYQFSLMHGLLDSMLITPNITTETARLQGQTPEDLLGCLLLLFLIKMFGILLLFF